MAAFRRHQPDSSLRDERPRIADEASQEYLAPPDLVRTWLAEISAQRCGSLAALGGTVAQSRIA